MYVSRLLSLRDEAYGRFQSALLPSVQSERVIGVRTPVLRLLAKEMLQNGTAEPFLLQLPHFYFEENQLHAFIITAQKDFGRCLMLTENFLPYIDNWATCDQLVPKALTKDKDLLMKSVRRWLKSTHTYTIRFGIGVLMRHFLDGDFREDYLHLVASVRSEEYYVNMMIAWYFATALAKQYAATLPYLQRQALSPWTHNKVIQKAIESYRITPVQKEYLKTLRMKRANKEI